MRIRINLSFIIVICLAWSYLLHPIYGHSLWGFAAYPLIISALLIFLAHLYNSLVYEFQLSARDIGVFLLYVTGFSLLSNGFLGLSLGGDELYHAQRSSSYWFVHEMVGCSTWLRSLPITLVNSYASLLIVLAGFGLYALNKKMSHNFSGRYLYFFWFLQFSLLGWLFTTVDIPVESHPPLRLLPLFVSQLFFGLDDLSFRIPGILAVSLIAFLTYKLTIYSMPGKHGYAFFVGAMVLFIPTVFHAAWIVEPSIWVFIFGSLGIFCFYWGDIQRDERYLILGCALFGLGVLFRQNIIIFWPAAGIYLLVKKKIITRPLLLVIPMIFSLPFFFTLAHVGHPAVRVNVLHSSIASPLLKIKTENQQDIQKQNGPKPIKVITAFKNILNSIIHFTGPRLILNSSDIFWVLFFIFGGIYVLFFKRHPIGVFFLVLLVGYMLIHSLFPAMWGIGRYQVEYIAPCTWMVILLAFGGPLPAGRTCLLVMLLLCSHSYFFNRTISHDIYFQGKFERRLSTDFSFPYKQALSFIHGQETGGKFLIMGGGPVHEEVLLWLRGFNQNDCDVYSSILRRFKEFLETPFDAQTFREFIKEQDISFVLVEHGEKRARMNRSENTSILIDGLSEAVPSYSFSLPNGGAIDIYRF